MSTDRQSSGSSSRRDVLRCGASAFIAGGSLAVLGANSAAAHAAAPTDARKERSARDPSGSFVVGPDGVQIYFKDWGDPAAQPIVFHHGWPLSADDWDAQMLYFAAHGYRVIAHDRRGHGRSSQVSDGHDMDH